MALTRKQIFLICFAIPDEYLDLHLCERAREYCLKLNPKVNTFSASYSCLNLIFNSFLLYYLSSQVLQRLHKVASISFFYFLWLLSYMHCEFTTGQLHLALTCIHFQSIWHITSPIHFCILSAVERLWWLHILPGRQRQTRAECGGILPASYLRK